MITNKICFAALAVVRDAQSNAISAFNILEGMAAVGLPFFIQTLAFYALWQREQGDPRRVDGVFTVAVGDDVLTQAAIHVDFEDNTRHRTILSLNGLVVPRSGNLRFRIDLEIEGHPRAEYHVEVAPPPPVAPVQQ